MINCLIKINKNNEIKKIYINDGGAIKNISEILILEFNEIDKINYLLNLNSVIVYFSYNYHFYNKSRLMFYEDNSIRKDNKNKIFIISYQKSTSDFLKQIVNEENINYNYSFENNEWYYVKSNNINIKCRLKELFIFLNVFDLIEEKEENFEIIDIVNKFNNINKIKINEIELYENINYILNINQDTRGQIFEDIRPFCNGNFNKVIHLLNDKLFKIKLLQEMQIDLNNKKEKEKRKI